MSEETALTIMFKALIAFQARIVALEGQMSTLRDEAAVFAARVFDDRDELRARVKALEAIHRDECWCAGTEGICPFGIMEPLDEDDPDGWIGGNDGPDD